MFHPTRGGTRGGQGLFKWEDVKEDKHRENYLGHSLLAPVGRWQKHKDLTWYTKDAEESQADIDNELAEIKKREAEALAEALGGPKRRDSQLKSTVSKQELQSVIKKDAAESLEAAPQEEADVANMKGLGFKRIGTAFAPPPPTVGAVKTEEDGEELPNNMTLLNGQASSEKRKVASADVTDQEDRKARKAKKKENKREKKEKKDKKKKKKREKRDGTDSEDEEKPVKRQRQEPGDATTADMDDDAVHQILTMRTPVTEDDMTPEDVLPKIGLGMVTSSGGRIDEGTVTSYQMKGGAVMKPGITKADGEIEGEAGMAEIGGDDKMN
ncbi:hypothetical protein HK104_004396 [Borealophlyctis nickersoniae]|nr:hypothetical protein HK104_004396 [Borealophlyctis nickersoniae]